MSQDELAIRVIIDPTQFREELSRLRRDLEDQHRIEIDKLREDREERVPEPAPTVVEIRETMMGAPDEAQLKQYVDEQIDLVRRERGLLPEESRVTPDMLLELFTVAINRLQAGQRWAWKPGEEDVLTEPAQRIYNMIVDLQEKYGGRTELEVIRTASISDSVAMRETMGLIEELRQDLVEGERFGRPGAIEVKVRRALTAYARGVEGGGGEGLMHKGLKRFLEDMSKIIKGGAVETGREITTETGGRFDVRMVTDITRYFGEVKTGDAGADARRQLAEYLRTSVLERFKQEMGWQGPIPEIGTTERARFMSQAVEWAQRVGPERIAARKAGEDIPPSIKGLLLAPYVSGNLASQLMEDLRGMWVTEPFVGAAGEAEYAEMEITIAEIPPEAIDYVNRGMAVIRRSGETPTANDWNALFMEWVSGNRESDFAKTIIKALNPLDPERVAEFHRILDESLGNYNETVRREAEAGRAPELRQMRTDIGRRLRGMVGQEGITMTDLRNYLRTVVPSGELEPQPRGPISGLVTRGAGYIAKFMQAALPERPAEVEEEELTRLSITEPSVEEEENTVDRLVSQLEAAEEALAQQREELPLMWEPHEQYLREIGATDEEIAADRAGWELYPNTVAEYVESLREQLREVAYTTMGVPMEYDPQEYLKSMKKVSSQLGYERWGDFIEDVAAKRAGGIRTGLKEEVGSVMALVGATMKGAQETGVLSVEERGQLSAMLVETPRFWELFQETPVFDPDTGRPEAVAMNRFLERMRELDISPDELSSLSAELRAMERNPVIRNLLGEQGLPGLSDVALSIKRAEQAAMDLEPAFGGSLDYWT